LCHSSSTDYLTAALESARSQPLPPEAARYYLPALRLLVTLCRELQRQAGDRPFYLGCRDAGRLLGVPFQQAAKWLRRLTCDAILTRVSTGTKASGLASQYHYLPAEGGEV
jgi:hypothetical protein